MEHNRKVFGALLKSLCVCVFQCVYDIVWTHTCTIPASMPKDNPNSLIGYSYIHVCSIIMESVPDRQITKKCTHTEKIIIIIPLDLLVNYKAH